MARRDASAVAITDEPESDSGVRVRQDEDPVLAAVKRAPFVPLTTEEKAMLAELADRPVRWIPHEQFVAGLGLSDEK
jgi:hypothetical protein